MSLFAEFHTVLRPLIMSDLTAQLVDGTLQSESLPTHETLSNRRIVWTLDPFSPMWPNGSPAAFRLTSKCGQDGCDEKNVSDHPVHRPSGGLKRIDLPKVQFENPHEVIDSVHVPCT